MLFSLIIFVVLIAKHAMNYGLFNFVITEEIGLLVVEIKVWHSLRVVTHDRCGLKVCKMIGVRYKASLRQVLRNNIYWLSDRHMDLIKSERDRSQPNSLICDCSSFLGDKGMIVGRLSAKSSVLIKFYVQI